MDDLQALQAAGSALEQRLATVGDGDLDWPSSSSGWSVYDLINHVNGGGHRYLLLMQGARAAQLAPTRTQDHVRPDPVEAHRRWQRPLAAAFSEPKALRGHGLYASPGERPREDLSPQLSLLLHTGRA